jgi:hypothetical protein
VDEAEQFLKENDPHFNSTGTQVRQMERPYLTNGQLRWRQNKEMPLSQFIVQYEDGEYSYEQCLQVVWTKAKNKQI